jgi:hypothetical protein
MSGNRWKTHKRKQTIDISDDLVILNGLVILDDLGILNN